MPKSKYKKQVFNVVVNPFTQLVKISAKIDDVDYTHIASYDCLDEQTSFKMGYQTYDIHIHYDAELWISIYSVDVVGDKNVVDFTKTHTVKLKFKMTD